VIFICYRREDSSSNAGRLFDRLSEIFGPERVFMDVEGIQPGEDFVEKLEKTVSACDAMLVVIGKNWLTARGKDDRPRLGDSHDYVRLEIRAGVQRKIRVIPVLVSGASMPHSEDLPPEIAGLARLQAVELRDAFFGQSLQPLIRTLENLYAGMSKATNGTGAEDPRIVERPLNLGFDGSVTEVSGNGWPHAWFDSSGFVSGVSTDYAVSVVPRGDSAGQCLLVQKQGGERTGFGSVMQRFPAEFLAGRTVRLEGDLRTEGVAEWAGLWLRADGVDEPDLFFDNMNGQQLSGTTGWARYAVEGRLPLRTAWLNFGVVLCGGGALWADSIRLLVWNKSGYWMDV